jgi:hypothetical protein
MYFCMLRFVLSAQTCVYGAADLCVNETRMLARCFDVVNVERQPDTNACLDEPHESGYLTNMENH